MPLFLAIADSDPKQATASVKLLLQTDGVTEKQPALQQGAGGLGLFVL